MIRLWAISARVAKPQYIVRPSDKVRAEDRAKDSRYISGPTVHGAYAYAYAYRPTCYEVRSGSSRRRQICALVWFIGEMAFRRDFWIILCCIDLRYVQVRLEDYVLRQYLIVPTIRMIS